ncbi:hypothetical protein F3Y22_tig00110332pilonHSYRG01330 [Hibiscus syriacus]|uniref:RRM domain-containing protein n=1 Tax=Hibiscus syriacus TaxID=106335 RepID=A0A6A3AXT5_HIBSY|nr:hypothetical protein F3Y22_tig00110332pilonHSYRG01330 [Hibiscus syriacus]
MCIDKLYGFGIILSFPSSLFNPQALEGFPAVLDQSYRVSYDERRYLVERYSRDNVYFRGSYHIDFLERENQSAPPAASGIWSQSRRTTYEEEYPHNRDSRRHQKPYADSYSDMDTFRDHEITQFQDFDKFRDGYHGVDNFRNHEFDRSSKFGGRERDSSYDDYDYRPRISHQSRDTTTVRGIMNMADIVMILIMKEAVRERAIGGSAPSTTIVVKGLSQKTTEEDLYQILAEWGPLCHVRVIKERHSGIFLGFAFIDFPSVGAASTMMERIGDDGLVDGRKFFFEYRNAFGRVSGGSDLWLKGVLLGLSPPRVEAFLWQLAHQKVAVKAELGEQRNATRVKSLIWKFIPGVVFWSIWKARNAMEDVLIGDPSLADGIQVHKSKDCQLTRWIPPPVDFLKMNVDGAVTLDGSDGGIGGILKDWNGCTLLNFSENVGQGPPPVVELKAIKRGIEVIYMVLGEFWKPSSDSLLLLLVAPA